VSEQWEADCSHNSRSGFWDVPPEHSHPHHSWPSNPNLSLNVLAGHFLDTQLCQLKIRVGNHRDQSPRSRRDHGRNALAERQVIGSILIDSVLECVDLCEVSVVASSEQDGNGEGEAGKTHLSRAQAAAMKNPLTRLSRFA